jgi:hypothetical protein
VTPSAPYPLHGRCSFNLCPILHRGTICVLFVIAATFPAQGPGRKRRRMLIWNSGWLETGFVSFQLYTCLLPPIIPNCYVPPLPVVDLARNSSWNRVDISGVDINLLIGACVVLGKSPRTRRGDTSISICIWSCRHCSRITSYSCLIFRCAVLSCLQLSFCYR